MGLWAGHAMVTARRSNNAQSVIDNWQEHVDGKPQFAPPIPPLAPAKFTGSLWLTGRSPVPECVDFFNSQQYETADYVPAWCRRTGFDSRPNRGKNEERVLDSERR